MVRLVYILPRQKKLLFVSKTTNFKLETIGAADGHGVIITLNNSKILFYAVFSNVSHVFEMILKMI